MKTITTWTIVGAICWMSAGLRAADPAKPAKADRTGLKKENAELRGRVGKLEGEVEQLKKLVQQQTEAMKVVRKSEKKRLAKEDLEQIRALIRAEAGNGGNVANVANVWANLDIQLYGFIKLDAAWDGARTSVGNFARWVETEHYNGSDHQFNMTANQTRLGLKIKGPDVGSAKTSGQVEMDFYGGGAENKPHPFMRHAFMKIEWPEHRFSIIAGQTWDVISPLNAPTLNYSVLWWVGNIGYRRPQIRATKEFTIAKDVDLKLEVALLRSIGHDHDFDPGDTGEDSGMPSVQGRASVTFPLFGEKRTTVGISGHYGKEEYDLTVDGSHMNVASWSANLDVNMPINDWLTVKGELFTGQDLDAYLGGIGQGVDVMGDSITELKSCGGWIAASLGPWDRWRFNVGAGVDAVNDEDFSSPSTMASPKRTYNRCIFGNVIYALNPNTSIGVEVSHWKTDYHQQGGGDSFRFQTSFIYKF